MGRIKRMGRIKKKGKHFIKLFIFKQRKIGKLFLIPYFLLAS